MPRRITYEWIVKVFRLKKCLNCRFYQCRNCCYTRTATPVGEFYSCCHFSHNGYYDRYRDFLAKVIEYHDKHSLSATIDYIDKICRKYQISEYRLTSEPKYTRIWFNMEGDYHYCHFGKDWYELDANVILGIGRQRIRR